MSKNFVLGQDKLWTRRNLLKMGLMGSAVIMSAGLWQFVNSHARLPVRVPPIDASTANNLFNPMHLLRDFDYGTLKQENGRTIREFKVTATNSLIELNNVVSFNAWTFNNRIPGPTLRAKQGDRIRIIFENKGGHSHSMHFHGIHPANVDGVRPVTNGKSTIYEFDAEPYGVQLYHCHIEPVTRHISKGLYGMFIIDPPQPRPPADEMVLVMGGYDINDDDRNELYAFNGYPEYYSRNPIRIYQNQLVRLYVLNMIEFDVAATFHLHANFFQVYPTGMTLKPTHETDVITMGTAQRHILEFSYKYTGKYMFHPHQDFIAEHGCIGEFEVLPQNQSNLSSKTI
ncbi:multicopper oxidase domain-containing protein [Mastigocoleus testarum]|uniref:Copper-containing nitrite reductase n=1 Tax=Mastigocoleus testarum BC008 TaxID=371196 RepID=A0A0V7ZQL9_9CYAN|nr:multicopper oxidase domain-containing protein [Mastigocoleus testarum]KST66502.1 copper oxidase [Mastigocoleus testarum BC008]